MDVKDQYHDVHTMAQSQDKLVVIFSPIPELLGRIATALESLDKSVKLIQEAINNPDDDKPVGMVVKPQP